MVTLQHQHCYLCQPQAELLADPSSWSGLSLYSPLNYHQILTWHCAPKMQVPFIPCSSSNLVFALGQVPAEMETQPNRSLLSFATGNEGPGQSKRCTVPCWQSWRWSARLLTCSEPPSIHSWPRLKNRNSLRVIHLKSKRSVMICYSLHPEKHTSDILSLSTNYHNS